MTGYGSKPRRLGAAALALALASCGGTVQVRGNLPDAEMLGEIETGVHSRQDVAQMIGTPSTLSTFQDRKWYYIGQKTSQFAFMKPEVVERSVLVVTFDQGGRVDETTLYTLEDGQIIDPVSRVTPTEGRELSVLQQLFGNIGRFPDEETTAGGRRR